MDWYTLRPAESTAVSATPFCDATGATLREGRLDQFG